MRSVRRKLNDRASYNFPKLSYRGFKLEGLGISPPERHGHINGLGGARGVLKRHNDHRRYFCTPFGGVMRSLWEIE